MKTLRFLAVVWALGLISCSVPEQRDRPTAPPATATPTPPGAPTRTPSPTLSPAPTATLSSTLSPALSQTPTPEFDPSELAPIGAYEVIARGAETTLHVWIEFSEDCQQVGESTIRRDGFTFDVTILMVRPEGAACAQGWFPTEVNIPLDTAGLASGTYTIAINGSGSNSLTWEYNANPPAPPAGCPVPTADTAVYVSVAEDYCVLMPVGWHAQASGYRSPLLTGGSESVIVGLSFSSDSAAEGRTVDQVVEQFLSELSSDPNLTLTRTVFQLEGERMILVEGIPSRGEEYDWWVIHNNTVYLGALAFRNFGPAGPHFDTAFDLFIRSLHWLR